MAFKSMLRCKGVRVASIAERAAGALVGRLKEAIIEGVDEFYSEDLGSQRPSAGAAPASRL